MLYDPRFGFWCCISGAKPQIRLRTLLRYGMMNAQVCHLKYDMEEHNGWTDTYAAFDLRGLRWHSCVGVCIHKRQNKVFQPRKDSLWKAEKNCLSLAGVPVRLIYGVFLFPTYNFTKTYPNGSHWYSVYLSVMWCLIMGAFLNAFPAGNVPRSARWM